MTSMGPRLTWAVWCPMQICRCNWTQGATLATLALSLRRAPWTRRELRTMSPTAWSSRVRPPDGHRRSRAACRSCLPRSLSRTSPVLVVQGSTSSTMYQRHREQHLQLLPRSPGLAVCASQKPRLLLPQLQRYLTKFDVLHLVVLAAWTYQSKLHWCARPTRRRREPHLRCRGLFPAYNIFYNPCVSTKLTDARDPS